MSNASLASGRPIVRYPEVAAHMMTCATCRTAGPVKLLTFEGGGPWSTGHRRDPRCPTGQALDRQLIDHFYAVTENLREQVKQLVRRAIVTLGVDAPNITEQVDEALEEILDETADPKHTEHWRKVKAEAERFAEERMGSPLMQVARPDDADDRDDAMMALESLARQGREDDFRRLAQRKRIEHADVLWSAMRFRYLEEC